MLALASGGWQGLLVEPQADSDPGLGNLLRLLSVSQSLTSRLSVGLGPRLSLSETLSVTVRLGPSRLSPARAAAKEARLIQTEARPGRVRDD